MIIKNRLFHARDGEVRAFPVTPPAAAAMNHP